MPRVSWLAIVLCLGSKDKNPPYHGCEPFFSALRQWSCLLWNCKGTSSYRSKVLEVLAPVTDAAKTQEATQCESNVGMALFLVLYRWKHSRKALVSYFCLGRTMNWRTASCWTKYAFFTSKGVNHLFHRLFLFFVSAATSSTTMIVKKIILCNASIIRSFTSQRALVDGEGICLCWF